MNNDVVLKVRIKYIPSKIFMILCVTTGLQVQPVSERIRWNSAKGLGNTAVVACLPYLCPRTQVT